MSATYFSPAGIDTNAGTEAAPLATLGPAIVLSGGGMIVALTGSYSMCGWAFSAPITIAAKEGAAVIFNACRLPLWSDFLFIAITFDSNGLDLYGVNGELRDCVIRFASSEQGGGACGRALIFKNTIESVACLMTEDCWGCRHCCMSVFDTLC